MRRLFFLLILFTFVWSAGKAPHAQVAKAVYLAPFDGTGTDVDPFVVRGADNLTGCIDMRPDETKATGWAICGRANIPASVGLVSIASAVNGVPSVAQKAAIEARLLPSGTLTSTDLPSMLSELLIDKAPKARKLTPGADGKYKIYLGGPIAAVEQTAWLWDGWHLQDGGLVADASNTVLGLIEPALAWATTVSENWNCADNASPTCQLSWTELTTTNWAIVSNQMSNTVIATGQMARADSPVSTDSHQAVVTRVTHSGTGGGTFRCGVANRKDNSATLTFYAFVGNQSSGGSNQHELIKLINGTTTVLSTNATAVANGPTLGVLATGSSISGYLAGNLLIGPITDTSITGNTYGGVFQSSNVSSGSCVLDTWSLADYSAATSRQRGMLIY